MLATDDKDLERTTRWRIEEEIKALRDRANSIVQTAVSENRGLADDERDTVDGLVSRIDALRDVIVEDV